MSSKLLALRFVQDGRVFYSVCLTGKQLLDETFASIDKWTPNHPNGYQRDPSERRFAKIAGYLRGEQGVPGVLPQSVLLGLRGKARFELTSAGAGCDFGTLVIPDALLPLREVDGQHRLGGLRAAAADPMFHMYPIPAVICEDSAATREAMMFLNINTTSVKVPVDLAQRLIAQQAHDPATRAMLVATGRQWIPRATELVDRLKETPNQPWHQFITVPGTDDGCGVRQNTMVRSLQPLLAGDHVYKTQSVDTLATLLVWYWRAAAAVWPDATAAATRKDFALMKSVGVLTLHGVAPQIFETVRARGGKLAEAAFADVMADLARDVPQVFWSSRDGEAGRAGTDHKAVRFLSDHLLEALGTNALQPALV
jgi:DGQHR domain-containing protein